MTSMIRADKEETLDAMPEGIRETRSVYGVVVASAFFVIAGFAVLASLYARNFGLPILLLHIAILAISVLCMLFVLSQQAKSQNIQDDVKHYYQDAFENLAEASLITHGGRPVKANAAYMALAEHFGAIGVSGNPPTVDRLFVSQSEEAAPAIFRLSHVSENTERTEETIDVIDPHRQLLRYKISVKCLGDAQFWQVSAVQDTAEPSVLTQAPIGLFTANDEGHILAANSTLLRWIGNEADTPPKFLQEFIENPEMLLETPKSSGRIMRGDTRLISSKGLVSPIVMTGSWQELATGRFVVNVALYGHTGISRDNAAAQEESQATQMPSAHMATGPAAEARAAFYEDSFNAAPMGILNLRGNVIGQSIIQYNNPSFAKICGGTLRKQMQFSAVFALPSTPSMGGESGGDKNFLNLSSGQCDSGRAYEAILRGRENIPVNIYFVQDMHNPDICWAYVLDISARKSLEDQLVQSQKMQAIGQLAAGVAHDFNNLLTAIRLNTDELLGRHPVGDPSYPELQKINGTVSRAAGLVKKLLAFSRRQTRRAEVLNVTETLSDMVVTLKQTIGERIKLNVVHGRALPSIMADKTQIDTILMNLCVNARDAMGDQGGAITISSTDMFFRDMGDDEPIAALQQTGRDHFIRISVKDTGTGMTDEVKAKIFEPFFTTKDVGKGTGLGLATVYGIVEQSGGVMDVQSRLGQGATFRLYFPVADIENMPEASAPTPKPASAPRPPSDLAGQGTILFVEDEASVRTIAAKTLRKRGYKVIEAEDGEEAYEILEDGEEVFDLMISDVVMPGMDGPSLLKKGRALLGDARIVFISGYAQEEFSDLLSEEPDVTFLPKPFTLAQLAEKVKAEIGESEA
ncbi:MAG: ATP-binding protein [Maricaulaceae bacterium]